MLLFCRRRRWNVQRVITHVHSLVLLIKPCVWWRSRNPCRRDLLKLHNNLNSRHHTHHTLATVLTYLDLPSAPSWCQRLRCFLRFPAWANPCPQCWHEKGLSPVCVRQCMARLLGHRKALPHKLQKNFFSRILSLGRCSLLWTNLTNTPTDNLSFYLLNFQVYQVIRKKL